MEDRPLTGFTVAMTAARGQDAAAEAGREELGALLRGRGARVAEVASGERAAAGRGGAPDATGDPDDLHALHDPDDLDDLVDRLVAGEVDAVTVTTAPAGAALLGAGRAGALLQALRGEVLVACLDAGSAGPLEAAGVPTVRPARARLAALVETVVEELLRRGRPVRAGEHVLRLRGSAVLVDGRPVLLTTRQADVLASLVRAEGQVLSRTELLRRAWPEDGCDEHAVDATVARLRTALGPAGATVQTVVKRGYRLAAPSTP